MNKIFAFAALVISTTIASAQTTAPPGYGTNWLVTGYIECGTGPFKQAYPVTGGCGGSATEAMLDFNCECEQHSEWNPGFCNKKPVNVTEQACPNFGNCPIASGFSANIPPETQCLPYTIELSYCFCIGHRVSFTFSGCSEQEAVCKAEKAAKEIAPLLGGIVPGSRQCVVLKRPCTPKELRKIHRSQQKACRRRS